MPAPDGFHPIIYVRGYAMTKGEQDETTADPFCGFNLGSTVYRAALAKDKPARKYVFESPVVRLSTDYGYRDVFEDGLDVVDEGWTRTLPRRSVVIYRYYEKASALLGNGETPPIEDFARGLSDLVIKVRDLVCADPANKVTKASFRCHLVAHSMGGLVSRAFLQNPALGDPAARACVDKLFTYGTPHNGVEMLGMNSPSWLTLNDMSNFNHKRMAGYLDLDKVFKESGRVDWIPEDRFSSRKVFCMVGTNRADYEVAAGISRMFAGNGSDGLVRCANATVWGRDPDGTGRPAAAAYAYRAHSGYFGIVNSEESYQNLVRFLFGDVRADLWLDVNAVALPVDVAAREAKGKKVEANYLVEIVAGPRGKRWHLTRRKAEEDSAAVRTYTEFKDPKRRSVFLSSIFLAKKYKIDPKDPSVAYRVELGVRAQEYEVEGLFWNNHFEGGSLFNDAVVIRLVPPAKPKGPWTVAWHWESDPGAETTLTLPSGKLKSSPATLSIPVKRATAPGIDAVLRVELTDWNAASAP